MRGIKCRVNNLKPHPIILKIARIVLELLDRGCLVSFLWVPSHSGLQRNLRADDLARGAHGFLFGNVSGAPMRDFLVLLRADLKSRISKL